MPEGCAQGTFVPPTLIELDSIDELKREVFGPVLHVVRYRRSQLDKLLEQIRATGYGLTLGIHTRIDETIAHVISRAHVGNIYVNRNVIGAVVGVQPFGGEGLSGTGPKAGGALYLQRLLGDASGRVAEVAGAIVDRGCATSRLKTATIRPLRLTALRDWLISEQQPDAGRTLRRLSVDMCWRARLRYCRGPPASATRTRWARAARCCVLPRRRAVRACSLPRRWLREIARCSRARLVNNWWRVACRVEVLREREEERRYAFRCRAVRRR